MGVFTSSPKQPADPVALAQQQRMREQKEVDAAFRKGISELRDFIAPSSLEIESDHFRLGTKYGRTFYIYGYPCQVYTGGPSSIINVDEEVDVSMFIYPVASQIILENLRKKVSQLEAGIQIDAEKGKVGDPAKQSAILDAVELRSSLQVGEERFFRFGLYITMYATSLEELDYIQNKIETILGQQLIYSKVATVQMEQGLN